MSLPNVSFYPRYWQDLRVLAVSGQPDSVRDALVAPFLGSELEVLLVTDGFTVTIYTDDYYLTPNYLVRVWVYVMTSAGVRRLPPAVTGATAVNSKTVSVTLPPGSGVVRLGVELRAMTEYVSPFLDSDGDGVYDVDDPFPLDPTRDGVVNFDDPNDPDNPVISLDPPAGSRVLDGSFYQLANDGPDWVLEGDPEKGSRKRSPQITHSELTRIRRRFIGPGTLSWSAKVSTEEFYDFLRTSFSSLEAEYELVDPILPVSGETLWLDYSVHIEIPGYLEFCWFYEKDSSVTDGRDDCFVTGVSFTPD